MRDLQDRGVNIYILGCTCRRSPYIYRFIAIARRRNPQPITKIASWPRSGYAAESALFRSPRYARESRRTAAVWRV